MAIYKLIALQMSNTRGTEFYLFNVINTHSSINIHTCQIPDIVFNSGVLNIQWSVNRCFYRKPRLWYKIFGINEYCVKCEHYVNFKPKVTLFQNVFSSVSVNTYTLARNDHELALLS